MFRGPLASNLNNQPQQVSLSFDLLVIDLWLIAFRKNYEFGKLRLTLPRKNLNLPYSIVPTYVLN